MRPPLANTTAQKGCGFSKITFTVWGSIFSTLETSANPGRVEAAVPGSRANCQLKTTSSAVNGVPSCQVTFFLSFHSTQRPSFAMPPFLGVGNSSASTGAKVPSPCGAASGS
jgi:hypothetical protein